MSDYGHELLFGSFITPSARNAKAVVELGVASEKAGLDLVTFQDHPYQPAFLDTLTLMAFVAARTSTIKVSANVANLPLRPPAMLARQIASLDILSGGRFELGLGAGAFWDGIVAMGGRRLTPGQAVTALYEGIDIIRQVWATGDPGGMRSSGEYYTVEGAKRGPRPAHDISIWVGAYKPKMLDLTGRVADGWLPSLSYLRGGVAALPEFNNRIDEAALKVGRQPSAIRRLLNISGQFLPQSQGVLAGPVSDWVEQLADLTITSGTSAFILMADDRATIERFGREVAPAVRELVSRHRRA